MKLLIKNLEQIVQVCDKLEPYKSGLDQDVLATKVRRSYGVGCSFAVDDNGLIAFVGHDDEFDHGCMAQIATIDGRGHSLIPGLVDAHCHPVWSGDRMFEFELKMRGATYLDVHRAGGGIYHTVECTKNSTKDELLELLLQRLNLMSSCGSTLIECKTGYGLDFETELKQLEVIEDARRNQNIELVTTFLPAHAVPRDQSSEQGTHNAIAIMDKVKQARPDLQIDFVDVFCETGVYSIEQSKQILTHGRELFNCDIGFHGDELSSFGSAELAAELRARSISHLEYISDQGMNVLAARSVAAVICPTTAYLLRLKSPPCRQMIDSKVIVALGSDFNPNAYCYSMPMAMNMAVVNCRMTLNEALAAATINAAYALKRSASHGSLEVGKVADAVLIKSSDWKKIVYQLSESKDLISGVIKRGVKIETL